MAENLLNPWIREIQQPSSLQIITQQQQLMPSQLSAMFLQIKTKRFCANEIELSLRNRQSLAISRNKQRPLHISYPNENLQPYHHFKECHQIQKNANFRNSTSCRIFDEVKTCQNLHQPFHTIMQKIAIDRKDPECHSMPRNAM